VGANGWPSLTVDGLTMYFENDDPGGTIYTATRPSTSNRFGNPVSFPASVFGAQQGDPELSRDGKTFYFASNASPPTAGDFDLAVMTCN
jgi:hypothetical protein